MVQHGSMLHSDALMGNLMGETVHMRLQIGFIVENTLNPKSESLHWDGDQGVHDDFMELKTFFIIAPLFPAF